MRVLLLARTSSPFVYQDVVRVLVLDLRWQGNTRDASLGILVHVGPGDLMGMLFEESTR